MNKCNTLRYIEKKYCHDCTRVLASKFESCANKLNEILEVKINVVVESYKIICSECGMKILVKGCEMAKVFYSSKCGAVYTKSITQSFLEIIPIDNIDEVKNIKVIVLSCNVNKVGEDKLKILIGYSIIVEGIIICKNTKETWYKCFNSDCYILGGNK